MGNLQSVLGDCQIGQLPTYLQHLASSDGGDEAYVVYGERSPFRVDATAGQYSGPSQKFVRSNEEERRREKMVLRDMVELCVEGIDAETAREKVRGADAPGGQTFVMPRGNRPLNTEVWREAEIKANESGTVRASPGNTTRVNVEENGSVSKKEKKEKKSKKKSQETKKKKREVSKHTVDSIVEKEVDSYPEDIKNTLRSFEPAGRVSGNANASAEDSEYDPDTAYISEVEEVDEPISRSTTPTRETEQLLQQGGEPRTMNSSVTSSPQLSRASPSRRKPEEHSKKESNWAICRENEKKIWPQLTIVVAPHEKPDDPIGEWYIVHADWYKSWIQFLNGAARPEKISNKRLLNPSSSDEEPRLNLELGTDYVGVDKRTWNILSELYGSDCVISRSLLDLYSPRLQ